MNEKKDGRRPKNIWGRDGPNVQFNQLDLFVKKEEYIKQKFETIKKKNHEKKKRKQAQR